MNIDILVQIGDQKPQKCHCLLKNFLQLLYARNKQVNIGLIKKANGATETPSFANSLSMSGSYTDGCPSNFKHLNVGTGDTAVTVDDYTLAALIADGNNAGELSYGVIDYEEPVISGNDAVYKFIRSLNNNSGGNITIREIGLCVAYGNDLCCLIMRDVLTTPYTIDNDKSAVAKITFKLTP